MADEVVTTEAVACNVVSICPEHQVETEVLEMMTLPSGQKVWRCQHCLGWHDVELTPQIWGEASYGDK